jgi:hypothetical protein
LADGEVIFFLFSFSGGWMGTYTLISPIRAPFSRSGRLFGTNSAKNDTIVLEILQFSVNSAIWNRIEAENDR